MHAEQTSRTHIPVNTADTPPTHPSPQTPPTLTLGKHHTHTDTRHEVLQTHPHPADTHTQLALPPPTYAHNRQEPRIPSANTHTPSHFPRHPHIHTQQTPHTHTPNTYYIHTHLLTRDLTFDGVGGHTPGV